MNKARDGEALVFSEEVFTARFKVRWLGCLNPVTGLPYTPRAAAAQLRRMGYGISASTLQTLLDGRRANLRLSTLVACSALLNEPLDRFVTSRVEIRKRR